MEVDRDPCQDVSSIKRSLKSTAKSQRLTRRASLLSIPHLPQVSALSLPNQTRAVQRKGPFFFFFFCIFLTLVYGLLNRSLPLLAWTAASAMTLPSSLPNRGQEDYLCAAPCQVPLCWRGPLVTSCTAFTGTIWIIYSLNLAQPWHFDVWCPQALALTI